VSFFEGKNVTVPLHLKLDTGMTRLGLRPEDLPQAIELLRRAPNLVVEGVFQNYASSDEADSAQTREQTGVFFEGLKAIRAAGHRPAMIHVSNSGGILLPPSFEANPGRSPTHVRPGLILYARLPGLDSPLNREITAVMSFVSVIDQVKTVPAGTRVGYGGTFVAPRAMTLAIVPAGYADGVPRHLSGKGVVLIAGARCPIAGRISMDLSAVDVTDLPVPPLRGEEVVFFGTSRGVRLGVEEVAETAGTVSWELLCGVGPRVPRVIVENGVAASVQSKFVVGKG
jgi:alanine racemase